MRVVVAIGSVLLGMLLPASALAAPVPADAARKIRPPPVAGVADYQLGSAYAPAADVAP